VHAKGHRDKTLEVAEGITRAVVEMPPASSCAELHRKAQLLCHDRLEQLDEEKAEYDASTDHGRVTGIAFP
jgi:predicted secreted Zn-dependent protease